MPEVACKNCHFYDSKKQVCNNPNRNDSKQQYYYGRIDPRDYCALFLPEVDLDAKTKTAPGQV